MTTFCSKHNIERKRLKNGKTVCIVCNRERVYKWRKDAKQKLVEIHGNKCKICGYNKCNRALQFHHVDPKNKSFSISAFNSVLNWDKMLEESYKCILLCSNCHAELEDGLIDYEPQN